jgi:hypothetical protein
LLAIKIFFSEGLPKLAILSKKSKKKSFDNQGKATKDKMTKQTIKQQLKSIAKKEGIRSYVANDILESIDEYEGTQKQQAQAWYNDLMQGGCQSGFISSLIYYTDTAKFYDRYYNDIEDIRTELEGAMGESLKPEGDLKNWYAWLGFEETARTIAEEIGLEI